MIVKVEKKKSIINSLGQLQIITKQPPEPKLPMPFELPRNYPAVVMADLAKGMLTGKGKTKFVSSIAAAIFRFKRFPTREEYDHVGEVIVSTYPFLRSKSGTGWVRLQL